MDFEIKFKNGLVVSTLKSSADAVRGLSSGVDFLAMRCCQWTTCKVAEFCAAGQSHTPNRKLDGRGKCYDHKPYVEGGVTVWGDRVNVNVRLELEASKGGER